MAFKGMHVNKFASWLDEGHVWHENWVNMMKVIGTIDSNGDRRVSSDELDTYVKNDGIDYSKYRDQITERQRCRATKALTWFLWFQDSKGGSEGGPYNAINRPTTACNNMEGDHAFPIRFPDCDSLPDPLPSLTTPKILKSDVIISNAWDSSPIVIEKHRLILFTVAKNKDTVIKMLARRMMGYDDWNLQNDQIPHNPNLNGLVYLRSFPRYEATEMMTSPKWTRAVFLRDPLSRVLESYLDTHTGKGYVNFNCHQHPQTFGEFVGLASICKGDLPWLPQKAYIDEKWWPWINFIGFADSSTAAKDMQHLLRKMDLWEKYGSNGWGSHKTSSTPGAIAEIQVTGDLEAEIASLKKEKNFAAKREDYVRAGELKARIKELESTAAAAGDVVANVAPATDSILSTDAVPSQAANTKSRMKEFYTEALRNRVECLFRADFELMKSV